MAKKIFKDIGNGFEKVEIFASEFEMTEFPIDIITDVYIGYLLGGLLRKIGCRIRPYEKKEGTTDRVLKESVDVLIDALNKKSREDLFSQILEEISAVPVNDDIGKKPKVSIIGDLYVRDNDIFNQQLMEKT